MPKVKLASSDKQVFEVEEEVANESQTVKSLLEDGAGGTEDGIPLPNVSGKVLAKVIEFCKFHVDAQKKGADDKPSKSEEEVKVRRSQGRARPPVPRPGFDLGRVTLRHASAALRVTGAMQCL